MRSLALAVLTAVAMVLLTVGTAAAAGGRPTLVTTMGVTGSVFTCPDASYSVTAGTVTFVLHDSFAAGGSEHITSTVVRMPSPARAAPRTASTTSAAQRGSAAATS